MVSKQQQQRFLFFQVSFFESRCLGFKKGKNSRQKKIFLFEGILKNPYREGIFFAPRLSNGWMDPGMKKKARSKKGRRRFDVFL